MQDDRQLIDQQSLLEHLLELESTRATGVLTIGDQDYVSHFRIADGAITAADWQVDGDFFLAQVVSSELVQERVLKKAVRRSKSRDQHLAQSISQEGGPLPGQFRDLMRSVIQEELHRLASEEDVWWQFSTEGEEVAFDPNLLALNMFLTIQLLVVEIAGRREDDAFLERLFPEPGDVLVPNESCRRYFDGATEHFEDERAVVVLIDGERDVGEIVAEAGLPEFRCLQLLHRFKLDGEVRSLNAAELVQVATTFKAKGRFDKCLRLYLQAEALGGESFDLDLTIGGIYETIGQQDEAYDRYVGFADRCLNSGDRKAAQEALQRALALRPSNIELRERHLEILDPVADRDRYVRETRTFLGLTKSAQDHARSERALRSLIVVGHAEADDIRTFITLLIRERGAREAFNDLRALALELLGDDRFGDARGVLEAAAELRPGHAEVLDGLARVYQHEGESERAVDALDGLIRALHNEDLSETERDTRIRAAQARLLESAPRHPVGLTFAAREALAKGDRDVAAGHLRTLASVHREAPDVPRLTAVLRKLHALVPDDTDVLAELGDCHFAAGRLERGAEAKRKAAERLGGDTATARQAEVVYRDVLDRMPFDVDALEGLAGLHLRSGDRNAHRRSRMRLAATLFALGRARDAGDVYAEIAEADASDAECVRHAAMCYARVRNAADIGDALKKLVERLLERGDRGLADALVRAAGRPDDLVALVDRHRAPAAAAAPTVAPTPPAPAASPAPTPAAAPAPTRPAKPASPPAAPKAPPAAAAPASTPKPTVATPEPAPAAAASDAADPIAAAKAKLAQLTGKKVEKRAPTPAADPAADAIAAGGLKSDFEKEKKTTAIPAGLKASIAKLRGLR